MSTNYWKRAGRSVVRIELSRGEVAKYEKSVEASGMTHVAVHSRLVEFLARQPALVQAAILGRYPEEVQKELAKTILRRMAGEG